MECIVRSQTQPILQTDTPTLGVVDQTDLAFMVHIESRILPSKPVMVGFILDKMNATLPGLFLYRLHL
jgi:hypothetical protein